MAKVLISSLGTGNLGENNISAREYKETKYRFQGSNKDYSTPFVTSALSENLKVDKIYLVGTSKSMWEEVYNYFSKAGNQPLDNTYWEELVEKISSFKLGDDRIKEKDLEKVNKAIDNYLKRLRSTASGGSRCYIIDYGLNEAELWNNFDIFMRIGENLNEHDEIFLDITHAFRSIPLFNYLMLDLVSIMKSRNGLKLAGLYYGMREAILEFGYAPIVDLSPLYNITLWARGVYNFTNYGNGYLLADLIEDDNISTKVKNISDIVNINYIDDFKKEIDKLNSALKSEELANPVVKYMQPYLRNFTDRFKGISSSSKLQLSLAKWYFDNYRFANGYICLAESIVTRILEIYRDKDSKVSFKKDNREKVKNLIIEKLQYEKRPEYKIVYEQYHNISNIRNVIAHAGFVGKRVYQNDIKNAYWFLQNVEKHVFATNAIKQIPEIYPF